MEYIRVTYIDEPSHMMSPNIALISACQIPAPAENLISPPAKAAN